MEPSKSHAKEAIAGKKKNKQRVTVLLCSNLSGTIKIKPLVIHYYKTLPAVHCSEESLKSENLSNIALQPLPANTKTHLQPMDAGIICSFKAQYRKLLVKFKIDQFNLTYNTNEIPEEINIKHAIDWIAEAWNNISCDTILNCWKKTDIIESSRFLELDIPETPSSSSTITGELISQQQYDIKEIQNLINKLPYNYKDIIDTNDYIEIDDSLQIQDIDITNEDIIDLIQYKPDKKIKPRLAIQSIIGVSNRF
ncbi:4403_t:CDS:2 [Diversispora eburnea]|uniref:4403_t:CDS:1 n=1 Tax=Diversispora eburnea TaxID=1213867 RepID=A0A9N9D050_9GLOM|nr:4403_t:CDS:2 [Diversispora eburnea]